MSGIQLRAGITAHGSLQGFVPGIDHPSITVALNENSANADGTPSTARWLIRLSVKTNTGERFVGSVLTLPPSAPGSSSNRVIMVATIPGAIGWSILASLADGSGDNNSLALLDLSSSQCCGTLGITAINAELLTPESTTGGFDRIIHLDTVNLPAAGAFTSQAFSVVNGIKTITYWITYTRGAAGGFPALRAQWFNGTETSVEAVEDLSSLVIVAPIGTTQLYRQELLGLAPADANPIVFPVVFEAPNKIVGARLLVAERGVTATPGQIKIAITGSN